MDNARLPEPPWPRADIFVTNSGDLLIKVELSEIRSGDLEITAEMDTLRIKGWRHDGDAPNAARILRRDIPRGQFELVLGIPACFELSAASATFLSGTLRIIVPAGKNPQPVPRFSPEN